MADEDEKPDWSSSVLARSLLLNQLHTTPLANTIFVECLRIAELR
jgi:hypothetical protein